MRFILAACAAAICLPAFAQEAAPPAPPQGTATSGITVTLVPAGDADRKLATYQCEGRSDDLRVEYINAAPNFLALLPLDDGTLVFANVISGSGARYASGKWVWWTKGAEADLYDVTQGAKADPMMSCNEKIDTP